MCVDHLLPLVTPVNHTASRARTRNSRPDDPPSRGVRGRHCYYGGSGNPRRPRRHLRSVPMTSFDLDLTKYQLGWSDEVEYAFAPAKGISPSVVEQISWWKGEPRWMTQMRLRARRTFERKPMAPWFSVNMPDIDFQDIYYYLKPATDQVSEWEDLPEQMKTTYEKLGIPEAERKYLAGVTAQYECLRGSTQVWTTKG